MVEEAWIDSKEKKGKARIRFGHTQRAKEVAEDVREGIRRNVSVGYSINEMVLESERDGIGTYRATDWEPFEISIVSIPADIAVGVGRNTDEEGSPKIIKNQNKERKMDPEENPTNPAQTPTQVRGQEPANPQPPAQRAMPHIQVQDNVDLYLAGKQSKGSREDANGKTEKQ